MGRIFCIEGGGCICRWRGGFRGRTGRWGRVWVGGGGVVVRGPALAGSWGGAGGVGVGGGVVVGAVAKGVYGVAAVEGLAEPCAHF